jgi:hypothetical protein
LLNDWSLSYGPLTIGDPETFPAVTFKNLDVMSMPEIRTNDITLIQRDGLWAGNDYIGGRSISLSLEVHADTDDEFSSAVNLVCQAFSPGVDGETPFQFKMPGLCNGREVYVNARTRKRSSPLDASFAARYCAFEVELFATDPVVYASEESVVRVAKNSTARVSVDGTRPVTPQAVYSLVTDPTLTNVLNGETHKAGGSGVDKHPATYPPGEHFLRLTDPGTGNGSVYLRWFDEWM